MHRLLTGAVLFVAVALTAGSADASTAASYVLKTGLPYHAYTPGYLNPSVTQANIHATICVSGYTTRIRPPTSYTTPLKISQLVKYGYVDRNVAHYEEDHLVSLEIGGSPKDPRNLWPEPYHVIVGGVDIGSYTKDKFENYLHRLVCAGTLKLATAQHEIETNWLSYWKADGRPKS